jgi:hypothetical protein
MYASAPISRQKSANCPEYVSDISLGSLAPRIQCWCAAMTFPGPAA